MTHVDLSNPTLQFAIAIVIGWVAIFFLFFILSLIVPTETYNTTIVVKNLVFVHEDPYISTTNNGIYSFDKSANMTISKFMHINGGDIINVTVKEHILIGRRIIRIW